MSTARPRTPQVFSDDSSDPGSLSDLESGWTDISSTRSAPRSTSAISDAGDSEDANSIVDRFDGEMWEGSEPEDFDIEIDENILVVDQGPSGHITRPLSTQDIASTNPVTTSSPLSESMLSIQDSTTSLTSSTPVSSVRSSRATLRLAFPDPLTSSNEDLFPTPSPDSFTRNIQADEETIAESPEIPAGTSSQESSFVAAGGSSQGSSFVEVQPGQLSELVHWSDDDSILDDPSDELRDNLSLSEIDRLEFPKLLEEEFEAPKPVSWSTSPLYVAVFLLLVIPSAFWAFHIGGVSPMHFRKSVRPHSELDPVPSPSQPLPTGQLVIPRALSPASLKSLAVAVFRQESKEASLVPTDDHCEASFTEVVNKHRRKNPKTIAASPTLLTLDPPVTKSLSLLPTFTTDGTLPGGTDKSADGLPHIAGPFNALSVRITQALSPIFTVVSGDIQELIEAIDMLLQSVMRLQDSAARGVGGFVQEVSRQAKKGVQEFTKQAAQGLQGISKHASDGIEGISKHASDGVQEFTNKIVGVVNTVGERASYRHARAKKNARKVRDTSGRYTQNIQDGIGRALQPLCDRLSVSSRAERRLLRRQRRQARKDEWKERVEAGKTRGRRILGGVMAWY